MDTVVCWNYVIILVFILLLCRQRLHPTQLFDEHPGHISYEATQKTVILLPAIQHIRDQLTINYSTINMAAGKQRTKQNLSQTWVSHKECTECLCQLYASVQCLQCWGLSAGYQPRPQVVDRGTTARYGGQLRYI